MYYEADLPCRADIEKHHRTTAGSLRSDDRHMTADDALMSQMLAQMLPASRLGQPEYITFMAQPV